MRSICLIPFCALAGAAVLCAGQVATRPAAVGAVSITRTDKHDRILLQDGKVLTGTIENKKFTVAAFFGNIDISAKRVVGIARGADKDRSLRVVLTDGQVVAGALTPKTVQFKSAGGRSREVDLADIVQCGYRISKDKPAVAAPSSPAVLLETGDLLAWTHAGEKLQLMTLHGQVNLPTASLLRVERSDGKAAAHRAVFANGSILSGVLIPETLSLKLKLGPRVKIARERIRRIVTPTRPATPAGASTVVMRNGDRLLGRLTDRALAIRTEKGEGKLPVANILTMKSEAGKAGVFTVKTWDGSTVSGRLLERAVTVELVPGGPTVKAVVAQIASIDRTDASPTADMRKKVETLIAQLGAESYKDREAAMKALIKIGPMIMPFLKRRMNNPDPEIRTRIQLILEKLGVNVE